MRAAEFADAPWARTEADRTSELRLLAMERRAQAELQLGEAQDVITELDGHAAENPLREEAWRLLALAHYASGRQGDALEVLRRARGTLREELGVDPGPALRQLERDVLAQVERLAPAQTGSSLDQLPTPATLAPGQFRGARRRAQRAGCGVRCSSSRERRPGADLR